MTELILVRHGETDWNRELRFQGQTDVPLNAIGFEQARRVAQRLAGESVQQLVSSDLMRAQQTAQSTAQSLGLSATLDAGLREQGSGVVDGMRSDDIQRQYPQAWARWIAFDADYAFEGGENARVFHARVMDALQRLAQARSGQRLLVVTHGGVLDMVYRTAMGLALSGPRQCAIPNGGISRVRLTDAGIDIVSWGQAEHLAGMPDQPVYDQLKLVPLAQGATSSSSIT